MAQYLFYRKLPYLFSQFVSFGCSLSLSSSPISHCCYVSCYRVFLPAHSLSPSIFYCEADSLFQFISLTLILSCCSVKINFNIHEQIFLFPSSLFSSISIFMLPHQRASFFLLLLCFLSFTHLCCIPRS